MSGPATEAKANVADSTLVMAGRVRGRDVNAMTIKHPAKVPAHPVPVMARPAMNVLLFGDRACGRSNFILMPYKGRPYHR